MKLKDAKYNKYVRLTNLSHEVAAMLHTFNLEILNRSTQENYEKNWLETSRDGSPKLLGLKKRIKNLVEKI